jgi:hypothetical protein
VPQEEIRKKTEKIMQSMHIASSAAFHSIFISVCVQKKEQEKEERER